MLASANSDDNAFVNGRTVANGDGSAAFERHSLCELRRLCELWCLCK
jgi:hypothetical protein